MYKVIVFIISLTLLSCSGVKTHEGKIPILPEYDINNFNGTKYSLEYSFANVMNLKGKKVSIEMNQDMELSLHKKIDDDSLTMKIDNMNMNIYANNDTIIPDLNTITGQSFNIKLDPDGRERLSPKAYQLVYETSKDEKNSIARSVQWFFPDLPDKPVKMNDTWPVKDTTSEDLDGIKFEMIFDGKSKLVDITEFNGRKCFKIESEIKIRSRGSRNQGSVKIKTSGHMKGRSVWYFDYENRILVKETFEAEGKTILEADTGQKIVFPMNRSIRTVTELK